jgi:hypothetical protein
MGASKVKYLLCFSFTILDVRTTVVKRRKLALIPDSGHCFDLLLPIRIVHVFPHAGGRNDSPVAHWLEQKSI